MEHFNKQACNILYVDDELTNLKVFEASFRREYNIYTASSGDEGLKIFRENDIQVIVTDQRMPGMTGVQFLQHLSEEPDNIRIILTGYSDMEAIIEAINTGKVYKYITKPWDKNELKITLDNALETVMLRRNNRQLINELQEYSKHLEEKVRLRTAEIEEQKNLQLKQQVEFAAKEKEASEHLAELKHQFMANMSHEIRTPMNAIVGMTRLLLGKDPRPDQLRYLNPIRLSANNLLVIINDILDLSKIEAGKIVIERTAFSIRELLNSLYEMLVIKAEEKNLEFRVSIDESVPEKLSGDPTRLNQVLINLAGNSIKFTKEGFVEIKAIQVKKGDEKTWLRFEVTDSGIGIAPEYINNIFDRFTQAGADVTRKFGGTGLGLAISKQIVNLMGGEISVRSEVNKGTTFSVLIPFEEVTAEDENRNPARQSVVVNRLNNLKILLVEDNEFNRMVAEDTLKETIPGITVDVAVNGEDAVERLKKENYDLVLMDILMPVMDGVTATRIIRDTFSGPTRDVKIIAMTANAMQDDARQYLAAGMDAYISKPFSPDELLLKMDAVMDGRQPVSNISRQEINNLAIPPVSPGGERVTNNVFLEQLIGTDKNKELKYIGVFLKNSPILLSDLEQAFDINDYDTLKIAAHTLKGQLSFMGVKEEISNIYLIEQLSVQPDTHETLAPLIKNLRRVCDKAFEELKEIA